MKVHSHYIVLLMVLFQACTSSDKRQSEYKKVTTHSAPLKTDTLLQYELADSFLLMNVKNQFYQSKSGHLYERTFAQRDVEGADTLTWLEYFNGVIPQDLDPLSFVPLNGWFAKDKNFAYYYRPVSGGMLISKLTDANAKTFKVLDGDYRYAMDNKYVYEESNVLIGLQPANLKVERNSKGNIIKLVSGSTSHYVEPVD